MIKLIGIIIAAPVFCLAILPLLWIVCVYEMIMQAVAEWKDGRKK